MVHITIVVSSRRVVRLCHKQSGFAGDGPLLSEPATNAFKLPVYLGRILAMCPSVVIAGVSLTTGICKHLRYVCLSVVGLASSAAHFLHPVLRAVLKMGTGARFGATGMRRGTSQYRGVCRFNPKSGPARWKAQIVWAGQVRSNPAATAPDAITYLFVQAHAFSLHVCWKAEVKVSDMIVVRLHFLMSAEV